MPPLYKYGESLTEETCEVVRRCRGSRTHSRKVSTHTRAPNEWNRGMGDGMEAQATDIPNKSYVRLGHVNARLRRRRSISYTPHILVSMIVLRTARRRQTRAHRLFTVSSHRLEIKPNVQWRPILFQNDR